MVAVRINQADSTTIDNVLANAVLNDLALPSPGRADHMRMFHSRLQRQRHWRRQLVTAKDDSRSIDRNGQSGRCEQARILGAERISNCYALRPSALGDDAHTRP